MLKSFIAFCLVVNLGFVASALSNCLLSEKPYDIFSCITINPTTLVNLLSSGDLKSFCPTANTYMSCMRTYVRDCVGGKVAMGALDELEDLNLKCCIRSDTSQCVTKNPQLVGNCFAGDNMIKLADNSEKSIIDVKVGDIVKAVDSNGNIINSEIVAIMHKDSDEPTQFYNLKTLSGESISLTGSHLLNIKNKGYVKASTAKVGDVINVNLNGNLMETEIVEINFEIKKGFIAPLTETGTILVNNIHASCYAEINSQWIADLVMTPMKLWYKVSKYLGFNESNNLDGIHVYTTVLQQFSMKFLPSLFA